MCKDNLKELIKVKMSTEVILECESIFELMFNWYMDYADGFEEHKDITYRGIELKIIYDVTLDDNGNVIEETDFITIRKDLEEQIDNINTYLDTKVGE